MTEKFACLTLDGIAQHGGMCQLFGYDQAKTRARQVVETVMQDEMRFPYDLTRRKNSGKRRGRQQPALPPETIIVSGVGAVAQSIHSDSQAMPPLGPTGANDGTAAPGTRTDEKTMGTLAAHD